MSNLINLVMIGSTAAFYAMMQMVLSKLVMAVIIALSTSQDTTRYGNGVYVSSCYQFFLLA